jgi:hypothetical protein
MRYEATIPVAEDASFIRFGLVLYGTGRIWLANAQLEVIEQDEMLVCLNATNRVNERIFR